MLSDQQIERYSRQILLPEIGGLGQERLLAGTVAVVGEGPLGLLTTTAVAASGIGRLTAPRSYLDHARASNPDCRMLPLAALSTFRAVSRLVSQHDLIIAVAAPPETTLRINQAGVGARRAFLYGRCVDGHGWMARFAGHEFRAACYACLVGDSRSSAALPSDQPASGAGRLDMAVATFIAGLLAMEAVKAIVGLEPMPGDRWLHYDALASEVHTVPIAKRAGCAACNSHVAPIT